MRATDNILLMNRWLDDLWNRHREETIDELFRPDAVAHFEHEDFNGPKGLKRIRNVVLVAFPDLTMTIEKIIADDDQAVGLWLARATHDGELMGVPPTHKKVEIRGTTWARIVGGYIDELWISWNISYFLKELLQQALSEVRVLKGILPICSYCKKIRNDEGYWEQVERYISERSLTEFSHSLCPDCLKEHYSDLIDDPNG